MPVAYVDLRPLGVTLTKTRAQTAQPAVASLGCGSIRAAGRSGPTIVAGFGPQPRLVSRPGTSVPGPRVRRRALFSAWTRLAPCCRGITVLSGLPCEGRRSTPELSRSQRRQWREERPAYAPAGPLRGQRRPRWGCPGCGEPANWACRSFCRGRGHRAPPSRDAGGQLGTSSGAASVEPREAAGPRMGGGGGGWPRPAEGPQLPKKRQRGGAGRQPRTPSSEGLREP